MLRGNVFFEVEKIEQLALINRLTTHHGPAGLVATEAQGRTGSLISQLTDIYRAPAKRRGFCLMSGCVKVFRCRPLTDGAARHGRLARKPGEETGGAA